MSVGSGSTYEDARTTTDRRRRLVIVFVVAGLVVGASVIVGTIGDRRVDAEVARIRLAAQTAEVNPATYAFSAMKSGPDPVVTALGTDATLAGLQRPDNLWCFSLRVERLLSHRTVHFVLALDGTFTETATCGGT